MSHKNANQYQSYYLNTTANGDGADTDQIVQELDNEGQVSSIDIFGPDAQDYELVVREHNGAGESTEYVLAGNSNYNVGSFEEPVYEFGAVKEIVIRNTTALSADDYGINIKIDELTG